MSDRTSTVETTFGDLRIYPLPADKAVKIDRAIRVEKTVILIDSEGKLYCSRVGQGFFYGLADWGFTTPLINALVKLKVISRAQAAEHKKACLQRSARDNARYALERLDALVKDYGIKVPAAERNKIKRATGEKP